MDSIAVRLEGLCKTFDARKAVDGLSLSVPKGSVYGFIGPNGSGKTTTLRMILRILLPDSGTVEVLGNGGTRAANDGIGYLPEERGVYRRMSVRRLLAYYGALKGMSSSDARGESDRWLSRLGLSAYAEKRVEALSKGMTQKLQFIATVLARPSLLVLDEPFSGLDPVNMDLLRAEILELARSGTTVLFSTHDMAIAEEMCGFICMIYKGRKVLDGTLDEIQSRYGQDTVRLRVDGGAAALQGLAEAKDIRDLGRYQEVRMKAEEAQTLLKTLSARARVEHFEVRKPTLHDIFVRIAGPGADDA